MTTKINRNTQQNLMMSAYCDELNEINSERWLKSARARYGVMAHQFKQCEEFRVRGQIKKLEQKIRLHQYKVETNRLIRAGKFDAVASLKPSDFNPYL